MNHINKSVALCARTLLLLGSGSSVLPDACLFSYSSPVFLVELVYVESSLSLLVQLGQYYHVPSALFSVCLEYLLIARWKHSIWN